MTYKADNSTTNSKTDFDSLLDAKVHDTEMTKYATTATTFTRTVIDNKFTNIINGAPDALNALKELSDALGADANFSITVFNKTNSKSNKFTVSSPLFLDFNPANPQLLSATADVSSKTESDSWLNAKANAATVYTKNRSR